MHYKKRSLQERLLVCQMAESGVAVSKISKLTGISKSQVRDWILRYKLYGKDGLKPIPCILRSVEEKRSLICEYQKKSVSLHRFCTEHKISVPQFQVWLNDPNIHNPSLLLPERAFDLSTYPMGRRKKQEPQTELERLQQELEYLRAENALLKKVRALMDEKAARLRGTGHKPSSH